LEKPYSLDCDFLTLKKDLNDLDMDILFKT